MSLKAAALTATAMALVVSMAWAGGHSPIEKRQAAMKTVGGSSKTIGNMLKGETPFDASKANAALAAMQAAVADYGDYFPEGADSPESEAAPAIWEKRAEFDGLISKFQSDIGTAVSAAPQDQAALQAAFGQVASNCKTCHEGFRVKKN